MSPDQEAAGDALDEAFADGLGVGLGDPDAGVRAAVVLGDDDVLRHVDQAPRQVTGVGRAQRGVGQTLARAVRAQEVLERRQPFAEVGANRQRDDAAVRVGHQTAHAGQLADRVDTALGGAGVGHGAQTLRSGDSRSLTASVTSSVARVHSSTTLL